ncbi:MAG TPA: maleylpyruvate isomerase family mycothiol-dependent enzyme [Pseudonocardiaceae bacterium]|jgi:uncharacterized protein (TIGR03083 family)
MNVIRLATQERAEFVALLETLTPEQWQVPSLCAGWCVHDVVAHMISYDELGPREVLGRAARGWFNPDQVNALGLRDYRQRSPEELVALVRRYTRPRGLTTMFGGRIGLTDCMIHQQDIRRPLGLPRQIPTERIVPVLSFSLFAPPIRGVLRVRGVRLVATDLDWSFGSGPEVSGTAEALLMAMAGRRGILSELSGPGGAKLATRIER